MDLYESYVTNLRYVAVYRPVEYSRMASDASSHKRSVIITFDKEPAFDIDNPETSLESVEF